MDITALQPNAIQNGLCRYDFSAGTDCGKAVIKVIPAALLVPPCKENWRGGQSFPTGANGFRAPSPKLSAEVGGVGEDGSSE